MTMKTPEDQVLETLKEESDHIFHKHFAKLHYPISINEARIIYRHAYIKGLQAAAFKLEAANEPMVVEK
jgi:hypothetical protein